MKTANALAVSAVAFIITASLPVVRENPEASEFAMGEQAQSITRPSDAGASCNALLAEVDQLSTEARLWAVAQTNGDKSRVANQRMLHLGTLLNQRSCIHSQAIGSAKRETDHGSEV